MSIRDKMNQNKMLGPGVGVALLLIAIGIIAFQTLGRNSNPTAPTGNAFFSDDNGKTFFRDDATKLTPFSHDGKQAQRVDIFKGGDGKEFAGLIYRWTDGGRR